MSIPSSFSLGPVDIHLYGLTLFIALVVFIFVARRKAVFYGEKSESVWELLPWVFIHGLIGARLYHVISFWEFYFENPKQIYAIWEGGLAIFGAIFGGVIGLSFATKKLKLNFKRWLDICAPALSFGQAIGRWGNFFNREIYGPPTNLPWGIFIEGRRFHPLFLYESLLNFFNFLALIFISRRFKDKLKPGDIFFIYLLNYGVIRLFLEGLRFDNWKISGVPTAQIISAFLILFSLSVIRHLPQHFIWRPGDKDS